MSQDRNATDCESAERSAASPGALLPPVHWQVQAAHSGLFRLIAWALVALSAVEFAAMIPMFFSCPKMDFSCLYHAGVLVRTGHADKVYNFGVVNAKELGYFPTSFCYPPMFAVMLVPLSCLKYVTASRVWVGLSLFFMAHSVWMLYRIGLQRRIPAGFLAPIVIVLALRAPSFQGDLAGSNCNILIMWLVVLCLAAALAGRDVLAGVLLALAAMPKITPAPLVLYFLFARRWRAAAAFALTGLLAFAITAALTGPACMTGFVSAIKSRPDAVAALSNHSIFGALQRILETGDEALSLWQRHDLVKLLWFTAAVPFGAATVWLTYVRRNDALYCFGIILCVCALLSPVTRESHLGVLLVPVIWVLISFPATRAPRPVAIAIAIAAILVMTLLIPDPAYHRPVRSVLIMVLSLKVLLGIGLLWCVMVRMGVLLARH